MYIKNVHTKTALPISLALLLITIPALASDNTPKSNPKPINIIQLSLSDLRPTQAIVGFDQVYYKLGSFQFDAEKLYDEICEVNGQQGVATLPATATPNLAASFSCQQPVGTQPQGMKTVVIGPDDHYYLTDGHHTFNVFWQMPQGGPDFKVHVRVEQDYRHLKSMADFWQTMAADGHVWLSNQDSHAITPAELPPTLGLAGFGNDPYRALMYFSRDVGWNKPQAPIPFLEFYWTKELRKGIDVNDFDLASAAGYRQAIEASSRYLLNVKTDDVGGSGLSATAMGRFDEFQQAGLDKLLRKAGKVDYMLRYKTASSGNGLAYDQAVLNAPSVTQLNPLTLQASQSYNAYPATVGSTNINAIVEIPAGTLAKWELDGEDDSRIIWEMKNDKPRIVNYLGYPGNYGTIPRTALPKELGGDGDPLDVLILGQAIARGAVVSARLIGVMEMLDHGEQDDKLIAVLTQDSPFAQVQTLAQLETEFPGVKDIVSTWFTSYKGAGADIKVLDWKDEQAARAILRQAQAQFP
ncbi:ParB-like protein [Oceanisphaera sp. IT1-181]|uniref:ParB-like protein n=1 Tax=Oceanisphaera sp. IT1-181 TaxID=3081199 RepID=UPI0029CA2269|nr:ParB-like protein [Oceanisphaera sp. IT1-181]